MAGLYFFKGNGFGIFCLWAYIQNETGKNK